MRRSALVLCALTFAACVTESQQARPAEMPPAGPPDRSQAVLNEIDKQQRWTREALAARPPADELRAVRDGDSEAISDTRKRLRRLTTAIERTTWIRDNVPPVLRGSPYGDRLVAAFDEAGRDRNEAFAAADEAARALAESRSRNAISLEELKRALQITHAARQSEQKLAANLGRAAAAPNAASDPLQRLTTVPMPPEPPFVAATARYVASHPAEERALDAWPAQLAQERTQVRASAAALRLPQPQPSANAGIAESGPGMDEENEPVIGLEGESPDGGVPNAPSAEGSTARAPAVQVAGDLKRLLARRGPPERIAPAGNGLTAFRYKEQRPCGVDQCDVTVDYLFNSSGRLIKSEVVKPQSAAAPDAGLQE
jgi:hypothetical protein